MEDALHSKRSVSGRGTGGTLIVVWKSRRDRGHPPTELAIQLADGRIGGQQHRDLALQPHGTLRSRKKTGQRTRGWQAQIAWG